MKNHKDEKKFRGSTLIDEITRPLYPTYASVCVALDRVVFLRFVCDNRTVCHSL